MILPPDLTMPWQLMLRWKRRTYINTPLAEFGSLFPTDPSRIDTCGNGKSLKIENALHQHIKRQDRKMGMGMGKAAAVLVTSEAVIESV